MAFIDELIRAKSEKLVAIREETASIINIVNEDDITKAVGTSSESYSSLYFMAICTFFCDDFRFGQCSCRGATTILKEAFIPATVAAPYQQRRSTDVVLFIRLGMYCALT